MSSEGEIPRVLQSSSARETCAKACRELRSLGMSDLEIYWMIQGMCAVYQAKQPDEDESTEAKGG